MIWGAISSNGRSELCFLDGTMDSQKYQRVLESHLLPRYEVGETFQQDNAPPHVSRSTRQWLLEHNVSILDWPSVSPDLNPIENVWSLLARAVYKDGKQFMSVDELKKAIKREWRRLPQETLSSLVSSMNGRIFKCIQRQGSCVSKP